MNTPRWQVGWRAIVVVLGLFVAGPALGAGPEAKPHAAPSAELEEAKRLAVLEKALGPDHPDVAISTWAR
jgi:hypothetical protein